MFEVTIRILAATAAGTIALAALVFFTTLAYIVLQAFRIVGTPI